MTAPTPAPGNCTWTGAPGCGPYDTMGQAAHRVRALDPTWTSAPLWRAHGPHPGWTRPALTALSYTMIRDACAIAGVDLGAFDTEAVHWLAHQEPEVCAVVAGLIERTARATRRTGPARRDASASARPSEGP